MTIDLAPTQEEIESFVSTSLLPLSEQYQLASNAYLALTAEDPNLRSDPAQLIDLIANRARVSNAVAGAIALSGSRLPTDFRG